MFWWGFGLGVVVGLVLFMPILIVVATIQDLLREATLRREGVID